MAADLVCKFWQWPCPHDQEAWWWSIWYWLWPWVGGGEALSGFATQTRLSSATAWLQQHCHLPPPPPPPPPRTTLAPLSTACYVSQLLKHIMWTFFSWLVNWLWCVDNTALLPSRGRVCVGALPRIWAVQSFFCQGVQAHPISPLPHPLWIVDTAGLVILCVQHAGWLGLPLGPTPTSVLLGWTSPSSCKKDG